MTTLLRSYRPAITVGVDGSPAGDAALAWATAEACFRQGMLQAVHVAAPTVAPTLGPTVAPTPRPTPEPTGAPDPEGVELRRVVDEALARVDPPPGLPVEVCIHLGPSGPCLCEEGSHAVAELVVVGRSNHHGWHEALFGSSERPPELGACGGQPVVVVPPGWDAHDPLEGRIVVGVDGTPGSREALRWAATEAARRNATLCALMVWDDPGSAAASGAVPVVAGDEPTPVARAQRRLDAAVGAGLYGRHLDVEVVAVARQGRACDVFLSEAADADMIVLGGRGDRTMEQHLAGSTTRTCVLHSPSPVIVLPPPAA